MDNKYFRDGTSIVLTGDSLSYNRYGYYPDPIPNAYECPADMQSWSFKLRNHSITSDDKFIYGIDLFGKTGAELPDRIFGDKSFSGKGEISFIYQKETAQIVLYLQCSKNGGIFDCFIDGNFIKTVSLEPSEFFRGNDIVKVVCKTDKNLKTHCIKLKEKKKGDYTVLGTGGRSIDFYLTGKGSMKVSFFIDNFEDRIKKYRPDTFIFLISGNDYGNVPLELFEQHLNKVFKSILEMNPSCNIVLLTATPSYDPQNPEDNSNSPYYCISGGLEYNKIMKKTADYYKTEFIDLYDIFLPLPLREWRFDNVHMNPRGNDILFEKIVKQLSL